MLLLPLLSLAANLLQTSNSVENWLPENTQSRRECEFFQETFGDSELILIGLPLNESDPLVEAIACRLEERPEFHRCWTPARLRDEMTTGGVEAELAQARIRGFLLSPDDRLLGVAAFLSEEGLANRARAVAAAREVLEYCQIRREESLVAGAGVVDAELDRLSSPAANESLFYITLACGLLLLWLSIRDLRMAAAITAQAAFAVKLTQAALAFAGGEASFLLSALPVLVMALTMSHSVSLVLELRLLREATGRASRWRAFRPCCISALLTGIGLMSLTISDMGPVREFGVWATIGSVVSLICSLTITPAIVTLLPPVPSRESLVTRRLMMCVQTICRRPWVVSVASLVVIAASGLGIARLQPRFEPLTMLHPGNLVSRDASAIETSLTPLNDVEFIVDFGVEPVSFADKLDQFREIEAAISSHPGVRHTLSLAAFIPADSSISPVHDATGAESWFNFIAMGERFWRISARVQRESTDEAALLGMLQSRFSGTSIRMTGVGTLFHRTQQAIAADLSRSLVLLAGIILLALLIALRSPGLAIACMLPSTGTLLIVLGLSGYGNIPLDLGTMLAAGLTMGLTANATLAIVGRYQFDRRASLDETVAARSAFQLSRSIPQIAFVTGLGTLPLVMSHFTPTAVLGITLALGVFIGLMLNVVMLPALLCLRPAVALGRVKKHPVADKTLVEPPQAWLEGPHVQLGRMKVGKI